MAEANWEGIGYLCQAFITSRDQISAIATLSTHEQKAYCLAEKILTVVNRRKI